MEDGGGGHVLLLPGRGEEAERREYIEATDKEMDMWLQVMITSAK